MPTLQISVLNKIPTFHRRSGVIVCCNDDYKVKFTFDPEWDEVTDKVARFVFNNAFIDRPINSKGIAEVPVIHHAEICQVGVYSASNAAMRTTTYAAIECENSIRSLTDTPAPPSEDTPAFSTPSVFTVTVTGDDTAGYTADQTFDAILAAETAGKVVQVVVGSTVYHQAQQSGDSYRAFSYSLYSPYVDAGSTIETSTVYIHSNGTVGVSGLSFDAADGHTHEGVYATVDQLAGKLSVYQDPSNVGKILVVGTDGNITLTDMPEGGASGDVVGTLDGANNILLTGALASGTYTLKYEYEDGTVSDVGIIEVGAIPEPEPEPTNLFVIGGDGYIESGRCSSTGADRTDASTCFVANYIKVSKGDTVYIKGYATPTASGAFSGIKYTGGTTGGFMLETETAIVKDFSLSNGIAQVTINADNADYVRFTIDKTYPLDSIVITVNQEIV